MAAEKQRIACGHQINAGKKKTKKEEEGFGGCKYRLHYICKIYMAADLCHTYLILQKWLCMAACTFSTILISDSIKPSSSLFYFSLVFLLWL